jgi:hypothetical protein
MSKNGLNGKSGRLDVRKTYKMLIGGAFVRSESGRALDVEAPGGKWLGHVCRAGPCPSPTPPPCQQSSPSGKGETILLPHEAV